MLFRSPHARRALAGYARVSSLAPWNASARREFVRVLLAVSENAKDPVQSRRFAQRAVAEARLAVRDRPASSLSHQALGAALRQLQELGGDADSEEIRKAYLKAVELEPVRSGLVESLIKLETSAGDGPAADRWRRRLAELEGTAASGNPPSQ